MTLAWPLVLAWGGLAALLFVLWRRRLEPLAFIAATLPPLLAGIEISHPTLLSIHFEEPVLTMIAPAVAILWSGQARSATAPSARAPRVLFALCLMSASLAAGGLHIGVKSDSRSILVAIDRSRSAELTPSFERRLELEWSSLVAGMSSDDQVAVVDFAATAHLTSRPTSMPRTPLPTPPALKKSATNVEGAILTGLTVLPADGSGHLVLITDGKSTRGSLEAGLRAASRQNVSVHIVPLERPHLPNLKIDRVTAPLVVHEGEAFDLRVVFESAQPMEAGFELLANGETIDRGRLSLRGGQDVVRFGLRAGGTRLTRYAVRCWSTLRSQDNLQDDNEGATFVQVLGRSSALVVMAGERPPIAEVLRHGNFIVSAVSPERTPHTASGWAAHDLVVVEGFPAERFAPEQLTSLATAVEHLGTGLLLMGSSDGLGPGGYGFSPLERLSPVSFDAPHERKRARVDLLLLVDASASMAAGVGQRTKLDLAHDAVLATAAALSPEDRLAVAHVNDSLTWALPLSTPVQSAELESALSSVQPLGSGIRADVALREGLPSLQRTDAHVKHVVVVLDADDIEGTGQAVVLARQASAAGITTSVISLGGGRSEGQGRALAAAGRGRHFAVADAEQLPAVLIRETLAATHNPVREVLVRVAAESTPVTQGIPFAAAPALGGYVTTIPKPRSALHLSAPDSAPVLASWSVGLGHMAVFASDYGRRWGAEWTGWPGAAQLLLQTARLLARPTAASGVLARAVPANGQLRLFVDFLGNDEAAIGPLSAHVVTPDGDVRDTAMIEVDRGRFASELPLEASGSYVASVKSQATGRVYATAGAEVGIVDELDQVGTDMATLRALTARANGSLLEHVAGVLAAAPAAAQRYQRVTQPLLWLAAISMLVGVAMLQGRTVWRPALQGRDRRSVERVETGAARKTRQSRRRKPKPERSAAEQAAAPTIAEQLLARRTARERSPSNEGDG